MHCHSQSISLYLYPYFAKTSYLCEIFNELYLRRTYNRIFIKLFMFYCSVSRGVFYNVCIWFNKKCSYCSTCRYSCAYWTIIYFLLPSINYNASFNIKYSCFNFVSINPRLFSKLLEKIRLPALTPITRPLSLIYASKDLLNLVALILSSKYCVLPPQG